MHELQDKKREKLNLRVKSYILRGEVAKYELKIYLTSQRNSLN